jgi:phasin family protein
MLSIAEQFPTATRASLDAQFSAFISMAGKALDGIERITDLNRSVSRQILAQFSATGRQMLAAKDPQEFYTVAMGQAQPAAERVVSYSQNLAVIASDLQSEMSKVAEAHIAEASREVSSLIDAVGKNAPSGSENAMAMLRSAMGNFSAGYEQLANTGKQTAQAIGENMASATRHFSDLADTAKGFKH